VSYTKDYTCDVCRRSSILEHRITEVDTNKGSKDFCHHCFPKARQLGLIDTINSGKIYCSYTLKKNFTKKLCKEIIEYEYKYKFGVPLP